MKTTQKHDAAITKADTTELEARLERLNTQQSHLHQELADIEVSLKDAKGQLLKGRRGVSRALVEEQSRQIAVAELCKTVEAEVDEVKGLIEAARAAQEREGNIENLLELAHKSAQLEDELKRKLEHGNKALESIAEDMANNYRARAKAYDDFSALASELAPGRVKLERPAAWNNPEEVARLKEEINGLKTELEARGADLEPVTRRVGVATRLYTNPEWAHDRAIGRPEPFGELLYQALDIYQQASERGKL